MLRTLSLLALATAATVWSQPRTYAPLLPLPQNHVTALSRSIAGRPQIGRPGGRPIIPLPILIGGPAWYPPAPASPPIVIVNQAAPTPPPAPVLIVNQDYKQEVARPVMREYFAESKPYENFTPSKPKVILLALKDGSLRQSVAFWREGDTLHFVQPDHKQASLEMTNLDRESTVRFNRERGVDVRLPE